MSRFKKVFKLRQHTPLIHFQADQKGATLRATELKPRFDRFLREVAPKEAQKFIKDKDALDYKIFIEPNGNKYTDIDKRDPLFFGNMKPKDVSPQEWEKKKKRFKQYGHDFAITFFSYQSKLLELIDHYFEAFLANTNFGTRKSKGFGSFYLADNKFDPSLIRAERVYSFTISSDWQNDIGLFYSFLRQGINRPKIDYNTKKKIGTRFYAKPLIWSYAKEKGWNWEKRKIKEEFFANELEEQIEQYCNSGADNSPVCYSEGTYYILRDLFGLSSEQTWMSYHKAVIKKEHQTFKRFPSPIQFKVIGSEVYFWVNNFYKKLCDQEFTISYRHRHFSLSTPKTFDFNDFFDYVLEFNQKSKLQSHIASIYYEKPEFKTLERIFNTLTKVEQ